MSKEWFPWYPARFRADTMHLTAEQDGIYRRLIDHYMETGIPLPDNDAALARIAGIAVDSWTMAAAIIRPFFTQKDGRLFNKKCDEVLLDQLARSQKNAKKGKAGAAKRWKSPPDNQEENGTSHESDLAGESLDDATRQDRTGQDSSEEDDKGSSSSARLPKISFTYESRKFTGITDHHIESWRAAYPAIDVFVEVNKAAVWLCANPKNKKQNLERFLANWMAKQQERAPAKGGGQMPSGDGTTTKAASPEQIGRSNEILQRFQSGGRA